ncbi:MAG: aspartate/glutamate racemase family protein [Anaerolineae bacterium]|nr:aspartate/glutamate racemase family protein [Anaerolineae bacterium]
MPNSPTIGILAGMGPYSTAPFVNMVIDECHRQYAPVHEEEFPHMLIYSLPTPFRIDEASTDHHAVSDMICAGLQRLEAAGVDFIAMPCNTAHIYYADLVQCIAVPLLNMIDIAAEKAIRALENQSHITAENAENAEGEKDKNEKKIGGNTKKLTIIGTVFTLNAGLYQARLAATSAEIVQEWTRETDELIFAIHANAPDRVDRWRALTEQIAAAGVDTAIIACTDLNVVSDQVETPFARIDATHALAEATVTRWLALNTP